MPSARDALAPSSRLLRSAAAAVALAASASVLSGGIAAADELAGTTVVGELVQVWAEAEHADADHGDHEAEGPLSFVETAAGNAVRVPTEDVEGLPAGSTISVTVGDQVDDEAASEHGVEPARTVLATDLLAAPAPTAVATPRQGLTNKVTVVLVQPGGAPQDGTTVADVVDLVDGPVADFWAGESGGAIRVGVAASRDWTPTRAGCADPTALWNEAAATVGFESGEGKHLMLYVTEAATDCAYALAQVGATPATGGRLYVRDTNTSVIAHELGHNFGLGHSSGRQCDAAVEAGNCRTAAYRDLYDVMGVSWGQLGSLNAAQAARLGVLPGADVQALSVQSAATTVTLAPLAGRTGIRAVRLTDAEGVDYWLEYRTPTARDAWLATGNAYRLDAGVLLRQAGQNLPDTSLLLDGTPSATSGWNADLKAALPVGAAVPVSDGDFSVVVQSMSAAGAVLTVTPSTAPATSVSAAGPGTVAPGVVMSAAGVPVMSSPVDMSSVPALDQSLQASGTPSLESAALTTSRSIGVVPVAVALVVGALVAGSVVMTRRSRGATSLRCR